jgi:hypothetical protein
LNPAFLKELPAVFLSPVSEAGNESRDEQIIHKNYVYGQMNQK